MADNTVLSQRSMPWGNQLLGTTNLYIHAVGCFVTALAQILGLTPDVVNEKLKAVNGYTSDGQIIWDKIAEAFPGWSAVKYTPYNNDIALQAIQEGKGLIAEVSAAPIGGTGLHGVGYIGNGQCDDPWTGTVRPTTDFPDVSAMVLISPPPAIATAQPQPESPVGPSPEAPAVEEKPAAASLPEGLNMYGLDPTNKASMQVVLDTWHEVAEEGKYVTADQYTNFTNQVTKALGLDPNTDLTKITQAIQTLKAGFEAQVQAAATIPTAQVEGQGPSLTPTPPVQPTLQTLPDAQKQIVINHAQEFLAGLKNLVGLN